MLHDCVPAAMDEHVDSLMEEDAGRARRVNKGGAKALRGESQAPPQKPSLLRNKWKRSY